MPSIVFATVYSFVCIAQGESSGLSVTTWSRALRIFIARPSVMWKMVLGHDILGSSRCDHGVEKMEGVDILKAIVVLTNGLLAERLSVFHLQSMHKSPSLLPGELSNQSRIWRRFCRKRIPILRSYLHD